MTQSEANTGFRNSVERILRAQKEFNNNFKDYKVRYTDTCPHGEPTLADDYKGDIPTSDAEDLSAYVNDLIDELQGIHDDLTQIYDEGIDEDDDILETDDDPDYNDIDDERQSEGEE